MECELMPVTKEKPIKYNEALLAKILRQAKENEETRIQLTKSYAIIPHHPNYGVDFSEHQDVTICLFVQVPMENSERKTNENNNHTTNH